MNFSWVLGGFLLLGFIFGWRKGLLRIVSGIAGLVLELYVAFNFNAQMGGIIEKYTGFTQQVTVFLEKYLPLDWFAAALPVEFLPESGQGVGNFVSAPNTVISGWLLYLLSFITLFFLTKLIFRLITRFFTKCLDHTLIGPLNRFLGGVLGAFFVALIIGVSLVGLSYVLGERDLPGANLGSFNYLVNQSNLAEFLLNLF
ncbi:MAG: CvpA family protein [Dehalobacterium sp.]